VIWQYGVFVLSLFVSGLLSTGLAVLAWRRRAAAGAVPLTVMMSAAAFWSFLYAVENVVPDLAIKVLLVQTQYLGIVLLPVAWLTFALQYTGHESGWSGRTVALLMIEPMLVLLLVWTDGLRGLVWHDIAIFEVGPVTLVSPIYGFAFWAHVVYSYLVLVAGIVCLISSMRVMPRRYWLHTIFLLVCGLVPWVGSVARVFGQGFLSYFDWTPVLFVVAGTGLLAGIKGYRLYDIVPIAQNAAFETLRDGVIVIDLLGRVVRINPAAEALVGCSVGAAVGHPLASLAPPLGHLLEQHGRNREFGSEIVLGEGQERRTYAVWLSPIREHSGELAGHLLVAQNISERRRMEELLLEERATLFAILQKAPYGVLLVDQNERCLFVNPAFTKITGYSIHDLSTLGAWFEEVFPDLEYRSNVVQNWDADTQRRASRELEMRCRDGRRRYVEFRPTLLGDGRALLGLSDVTERRRMDEALRQSEERYRIMADNIQEGLTIVEGSQVVYVNDRACDIFGRSPSKLMQMNELDLAAPEERSRLADLMGKLGESGQLPQELEFWIVRPDGSRRLVRNRYSIGRRAGEVVGKYILTTDITQSRQAEEALRASEAKYRLLAETARDIILVHDVSGQITYVNSACLDLGGYQAEDLVGRNIADLMPPEYLAAVRDGVLDRIHAEGGTYLFEAVLPKKQEGAIPVEISAAPMYDNDGISGVLIFARDISERRRAEETQRRRYREIDALYRIGRAVSPILDLREVLATVLEEVCELLEAAAGSIWLIGGDGRLVCREAVGPQSDKITGWCLDPGEGLAGSVIAAGQTLVSSDVERDPRHVPDVGHYIGLDLRSMVSVPLRAQDSVIGVLQVADTVPNRFDPTDVMFIEALAATVAIAIENARMFAQEGERVAELAHALEQQRELERLKGLFIQNVSHELRTPLAIALGYASLLDSNELGELRPEQREPVAIINRRLRSLSVMMDDFATVMDLETRMLNHQSVDLTELVTSYLTHRIGIIEEAELTLQSDVARVPPVLGNEMNLRRVLDKLVGNAIKFTPAGGSIRVSLAQENSNVVLIVADTGIGIPSDRLERIFDWFYQVDGSMSRRHGGTGLGLSVVKRIVDAHGGSVSVESKVGEGSVFTVRLPLASVYN